MTTNAGVLSLDVVPNLSTLGQQLTSGLASGPAATAARNAGESIASKFSSGLQRLGSQIGGDLGSIVSQVGAGFERISKSSGNLGLALVAAGGAAFGLGTALQLLGSKDEAAQQQLQAAITATGQSWGDYELRIQDAIHAGENFGRNAVETQNALQALTAATNDPKKALDFLSVAFNLAAARHIDLVSAAQLVARALDGNTRLLKQYGIDTTGVAHSTDAAAAAVTKLGDRLSGQAAASVHTFAGGLDVLKAKAGDMVASFAGPVGAGLQGFGAGLAIIGGIIQSKLITNMRTAAREAEGFGGKMSAMAGATGWIGKVGVGIAAVTAGIVALNAAFGSTPDPGPGINAITNMLRDLPKQSSTFKQFAADGTDFATTIGRLTDPGVVDRIGNATDAIAGLVGLGNAGPASTQQQSKDAVNRLDQALTQLVSDGQAKVAAADLHQMDQAVAAAGINVDAFHKLLPGYTNAVAGTKGPTDAAASSLGHVASAADTAKAAYTKLTTAMTTFNQASIDSQQADIDTRNALARLSDALKTSHGSMNLTTQAGRDARTAFLDVGKAVDAQAQSMVAAHAPAKDIAALYQRQHDTLVNTLIKMGESRAEAKRYADQLLKIPPSIKTQIALQVAAYVASVTYSRSVAAGIAAHVAQQAALHPAGGGYVTGAGTATSDSIPAMVSTGEYVLNAQAVQRVGVNELQRINAGEAPHGRGHTVNIYNPPPGDTEAQAWAALRRLDLLYGQG